MAGLSQHAATRIVAASPAHRNKDGSVLFLSEWSRSAAAAKAMTAAGYSTCFNVADGFEGPDAQASAARGGLEGGDFRGDNVTNHSSLNGHKEAGTNKRSGGGDMEEDAGRRSWEAHWVRVCDRLRKEIGDKAFKTWFGEVELGELKSESCASMLRRGSSATGSAATMAIACWPIGRPWRLM
jgi:hypothetical protein